MSSSTLQPGSPDGPLRAHRPDRLDTPAGHRDGAWVAEQLDREILANRTIHWRGLHYVVVSLGNVRKPNGEIYRNIDDDWQWLQETAGKAARWLGYVDFERIKDNRNAAPIIHRQARVTHFPYAGVSAGFHAGIHDASVLEPYAYLGDFAREQLYSLVIYGEKQSLADVVLPIADQCEADAYLPSGEISDTLLHQIAQDGAIDGRPLVRLDLPSVCRQGRPKDCSTSSSDPMLEGPTCRFRREARARERHQRWCGG